MIHLVSWMFGGVYSNIFHILMKNQFDSFFFHFDFHREETETSLSLSLHVWVYVCD